MKTKLFKVFTIICCYSLLVSTNVQGQEVDKSFNKTPQEMHDMFMQKHKEQKTMAWVTLGSGLAMLGAGLAISSGKEYGGLVGEEYFESVEGVLTIVGPAVALASVPFFISAGSNKRNAKLALKRESTGVGFKNNTQHISLSFAIPF